MEERIFAGPIDEQLRNAKQTLANNYQAYALGYQKQNRSGMTIFCYYLDSIIWVERALAYEGLTKARKVLIYIYSCKV